MANKNKLLERILQINGKFETTTLKVHAMIDSCGILTGSRMFGCDTEDSDIDVILPPHCGMDMSECVFSHNGRYLHKKEEIEFNYFEQDFSSCYVLGQDGLIYNLLFMDNNKVFKAWRYATKRMSLKILRDAKFQKAIKNKEYRVECFERYKTIGMNIQDEK